MDLDRFPAGPRSRRAFLRGAGLGLAGGAATALAACGKKSNGEPSEDAAKADAATLNRVLDIEHAGIAAYTAGAPLLKADVLKLGRQFLTQEKEHADRLEQEIRKLGGKPNRPQSTYNFAVADQAGVLRLVTTIENRTVAAYLDAIPKLSSGELRATAASILTDDAEHLSVLLGAQGKPPVPSAFVVGTR